MEIDAEASDRLAAKLLRCQLSTARRRNQAEARWLIAGGVGVVFTDDAGWEPAPVSPQDAGLHRDAVVVDARAYSDLMTPLHDVLAAEGDPAGAAAPTKRVEIRLWTANVLRQTPEEPVQPMRFGSISGRLHR